MKKILGMILMLIATFILTMPSVVSGVSLKTVPITLPIFNATSQNDMIKKIKAGEEGKTVTYLKDSPKVFEAEIEENGILYFEIFSETLAESVCDGFEVNLYLNEECTIPLSEGIIVLESNKEGFAVRVNKGTYWLKATPYPIHYTELNTKLTIHTAFVPDRYILDIYKSTNDMAKKVILNVKPMKGYKKLQIRKEDVKIEELDGSAICNSVWDEEGIEVANEKFQITENGIYTFRIVDNKGNSFFQKIRISNIDRTAPKKPVLKSFDKDSSVIKGKGEKDSLVFIKVGSKNYKGTVNKKGVFTVKTTKLAKGNIIEVYLKDSASNKSETVTVKVK